MKVDTKNKAQGGVQQAQMQPMGFGQPMQPMAQMQPGIQMGYGQMQPGMQMGFGQMQPGMQMGFGRV